MKISCIQMNMRLGEPEYNFSHACELVIEAADTSPDVIILPELWNTGFFPENDLDFLADQDGKKTKTLFSGLAAASGVNVIAGSITEKKNDKLYNTAYVFDRKGNLSASYSKIHLFSPMCENAFFENGSKMCVFELDNVRCGIVICYDIRFPELIRAMSIKGLDVLFIPAQWPEKRITQFELLAKARAVENQMFTVCCNSCGSANGTVFGGCSGIYDPFGGTLIKAGKDERIITAECDISVLKELRNSIGVFNDRQDRLYKQFFGQGSGSA